MIACAEVAAAVFADRLWCAVNRLRNEEEGKEGTHEKGLPPLPAGLGGLGPRFRCVGPALPTRDRRPPLRGAGEQGALRRGLRPGGKRPGAVRPLVRVPAFLHRSPKRHVFCGRGRSPRRRARLPLPGGEPGGRRILLPHLGPDPAVEGPRPQDRPGPPRCQAPPASPPPRGTRASRL